MMIHLNYHTVSGLEQTFLFCVYILVYILCCSSFSHALVNGARARGHAFLGNLGPNLFDDVLLFNKAVWS